MNVSLDWVDPTCDNCKKGRVLNVLEPYQQCVRIEGKYLKRPWQLHTNWIEKSGGFLSNYDVIRVIILGVWKYTPLYEKPWKKTKNKLMETTPKGSERFSTIQKSGHSVSITTSQFYFIYFFSYHRQWPEDNRQLRMQNRTVRWRHPRFLWRHFRLVVNTHKNILYIYC